jgi:hypothetical protein
MAVVLAPAVLVVVGCGGRVSATAAGALAIHASATHIDTNGKTRYTATLPNGEAATKVEWSVAGGDAAAGPGTITANGVYSPPSYLTQDAAEVTVNAVMGSAGLVAGTAAAESGETGENRAGSASLTVTPGFLQPLTPGNLAVGPNGSATIAASMTEVGGSGRIRFALATGAGNSPTEEAEGATFGTLSGARCRRSAVTGPNPEYTVCSVTYTAPAAVPAAGTVFVVGVVGSSAAAPVTFTAGTTVSWTRVLLNAAGINSNPTVHQTRESLPVLLGSSSGNNSDYDASQGQVSDCCGGTLGALVEDLSGNSYVLSNNHVLARSDRSIPGEIVIQPGLIDNGCTPYGVGPGTTPVATLLRYPALGSATTNVDAAIARVVPGTVDLKGNILELGSRQADGTLAAGAPGVSSTSGKGEAAALGMMVAKSGRTTGLTCAAVSAVNVDVVVDYFTDCAETTHAMSKTFTNQIAIAGTSFSDAGDSGALVVDAANAEPVGLFFAGGTDTDGVEHAIANPASEVLATLDSQVPVGGAQTSYSFVGGADHAVTCLNYGSAKTADLAAASAALSVAEKQRARAALAAARSLLSPAAGIQRVGVVASKDHPGEAAVAFYVGGAAASSASIPVRLGGLATAVLPADGTAGSSLRAASFNQALAVKRRVSAALLKSDAAIFGVGVGQSLDNPADAALILYVDRRTAAGNLPETIEGQRVRAVFMDRFHVTRSHGTPARRVGGCFSAGAAEPEGALPDELFRTGILLPE